MLGEANPEGSGLTRAAKAVQMATRMVSLWPRLPCKQPRAGACSLTFHASGPRSPTTNDPQASGRRRAVAYSTVVHPVNTLWQPIRRFALALSTGTTLTRPVHGLSTHPTP